jgi:cellulose synthase/poly-beta-1,6-N-acetylglucosamine synthase-like glycosyltransferase
MPDVGVVVIGRNEGKRLGRCLASLRSYICSLVYVDSGSNDGSVELARSLGVDVLELDSSAAFSAARARNDGFERLIKANPNLSYVQFVDGDCELVDTWIECAKAQLLSRGNVAAVCGRLRERFREASLYNRLCDVEWNGEVGEIAECGGIAMYRVSCFRDVGGFDPTIAAGEEPELCARLRARGWRIIRVEEEMGWHDAGIRGLRQVCQRAMRGGYGALDVAARFGLPQYARQVGSAQLWAIGSTSAFSVGAYLAVSHVHVVAGVAILGLTALALVVQTVRVSRRMFFRVREIRTAAAAGAFIVFSKWPQVIGHCVYVYRVARDGVPMDSGNRILLHEVLRTMLRSWALWRADWRDVRV